MEQLINYLLKTHSILFLRELTGIPAFVWGYHKDTGKGIDKTQYAHIKEQYIIYLSDKLKEVKDIDSLI